jgi:hypothetical protein
LQDLADVRARLVASQTAADSRASRLVDIVGARWKERSSDTAGCALLARRGERVRDSDFG